MAAGLSGCLAVWALAFVFSDLAMSRPRAALDSWEAGNGFGDVEQRRRLLERMGRAVAVNPSDAEQRMDLGRFFAWHAARYPHGSERHALYSRLAAERFEEAVAARPTWGFAWVLLSEQLARMDADETATVATLRRGSELAPLEPRTQLRHLWLGLSRWSHLDTGHQKMLTDSLAGLLSSPRYFHEAARIVLHHGRDDLLALSPLAPWQQRALSTMQGTPPS